MIFCSMQAANLMDRICQVPPSNIRQGSRKSLSLTNGRPLHMVAATASAAPKRWGWNRVLEDTLVFCKEFVRYDKDGY